jgi:hypothetical protein
MTWSFLLDKNPVWLKSKTVKDSYSFFKETPPLTIMEISEPKRIHVERQQNGDWWVIEKRDRDEKPFRVGPFEREVAFKLGAKLFADAKEHQASALVKDAGLNPDEWRFQWHKHQNTVTQMFVNVTDPDLFIAQLFGAKKFYVGSGGTPSAAFFNGATVHTDAFDTPLEAVEAYHAKISPGM